VRGLDRMEDDDVFDRSGIPKPVLSEVIFSDLSDEAVLEQAMESIDTVIHLAAVSSEFFGSFEGSMFDVNFVGLNNICEAAAASNVQRLVLTSSVMVVEDLCLRSTRPISLANGTAPAGFYAASKVFAETLGGLYARGGPGGLGRKLSVIIPRLGFCVRNTTESMLVGEFLQRVGMHIYLSHNDVGRLYGRCVESSSPEPGHAEIMFAMSKPPAGAFCPFDMSPQKTCSIFSRRTSGPRGCRSLASHVAPLPGQRFACLA